MKKYGLRKLNGFVIVIFILFHFLLINGSAASVGDIPIRVGMPKDGDFYSTDEKGSPYGYGYEYLKAISKMTDLSFDFVPGESLNECLLMLKNGEIDMLDTVTFSPALSRVFDYSEYQTGIIFGEMFLKKSNKEMDFGDFKSMDGIRVGILSGSSENELFFDYAANNNFAYTSIVYLDNDSLSAALQNGDVGSIVSNNLRSNKNEKPIARFSPRPFYIVTQKGNSGLMDSINYALSQILVENPNFNSDLRKVYYPNDGSIFILTDEERDFIKNSKIISVVYNKDWAPLESYDEKNGTVVGINADILRLISEKTGLKFGFIHGYDYEECIDIIAQGRADMLLSYNTNHRTIKLRNVLLSDTFLSTPIVILGIEKSIERNSVFAIPSSYSVIRQYLKDYYPNNRIVFYDNINECFTAIERGEAHFTIENVYLANEVIRQGKFSIVTIATLMENIPFALRKNLNINVLRIINKAINSITSSELENILFRYLVSKPNITFSVFYSQNRSMIFLFASIFFAILSVAFGIMIIMQINSKRSIWKIAYVDPLTGIGNLNKFKTDAEHLLKKNPNTTYIIEKLDIDRFKFINEIYGFEEGDSVLKDLVKSIEYVTDKNKDAFARIGSDEFVVLRSYKSFRQIEKTRILFENRFFEIHGQNNSPLIKFPLGRYVIEPGETDIATIYEKVNYAHRLAKQQKGHMLCIYDDKIKNSALYAREIELKMDDALKNKKFIVHLQPKYFISDNSIIGAEALVRWKSDNDELIYPNKFISLFEQNGFILKLDYYMVERVCEIINSWIDEGIEPVTVSVNFSRLHLLNHILFLRELCESVDRYDVPRKYIEIEFTESVILNNEEVFTDIFIKLNNAGFTISMDDFGTGYSSLGMLKNIPVDVIKMDKSFFANSKDPQKSEIVIAHVMSMARNLDISTVAEGVETEDQIEMLKKVGCDIAQGYYYSKPLSVPDFTRLLKARRKNI